MKTWRRSFTVEGLNLERFLRRAGESGIELSDLRRIHGRKLRGSAWENDHSALREMADKGGWQFVSGMRLGLGKWRDLVERRWLLTGAVLLALIACLLATQVMWQVDLIDAGTYEADIRQTLAGMGISAPMLRSQVNPAAIRDALEWRYPRIAWFECGWRGMTLVVRAVEGVLPQEDASPENACNVVAVRDGIVKSIVTIAGTPQVKVGQLVKAGDVLIKGEERTSDGMVKPVAARGVISARVWESASVRMSLYETETIYTGRQQTAWTVTSPWFDLWKMPDSGFAEQDIAVKEMPLGGFLLPLTLHTQTRLEAECTAKLRDMELLKAEGADAALQKLYEKAGGRESLVDNWVNWSIIEDEILLSVAIGERVVDIGQQDRTSGMAAPE